jgi:hypothetical protein
MGKGKIKRVNIENKKAMDIPFTVNAKHRLMETVQFENKAFEDQI